MRFTPIPILALLSLVCGCATNWRQAPSSSLSYEEGKTLAGFCRLPHPDYRIVEVLPTGSMRPVLDERTIVLAEPAAQVKTWHPGDIAVHRGANNLIIHSIIAVHTDSLYFKGENNESADGWVRKEDVLYRAVALFYTTK